MENLRKKMKEQPDKWIFRIIFAAFLASMVPIWYLSRFAVPGCDDYTYGVNTHAAWVNTHSVWEVLKAAAKTTVDYWFSWQGTYSSIFLMTLSPGIGNERWYFLTTFLMTGMLGLGVFSLIWVVLKKYVGGSGHQAGICAVVLLFLSFQTMVAPSDGLYWYNGSLHYVFMESLLFMQTAALLLARTAAGRGARAGWIALSCVLAFVLGGANLLTGLQSCILTAMLSAYSLMMIALSKKKISGGGGFWRDLCARAQRTCGAEKKRLWVILPLSVNLIGFGLNVLAPGNAVRETTAEGMGAVRAVVMSFYWAAVFVTEWMEPIVLAGFVLLCPVVWKMVEKSRAAFFRPAAVTLLSYCVFAAMFTPTLFATSSEGPDRCKNAMRVALYLLAFLNLVNALGWLAANRRESLPVRFAEEAGKKELPWMLSGMFWMGMIFLLAADKNTYTSVSAVRSLVNGEAAQFYEENASRLALYRDESVPDVTITRLRAKPYLLFKEDVGNEGSPDYWINISIVDYYKKNSLTVVEAEE